MKRWLLSKQDRVCRYCNAKVNPKIGPEGTITSVCVFRLNPASGCGRVATRQSTQYHTLRKCEGCSFTRRVTVRIWQEGTEHAAKLCDACTLEQSARVHTGTANRLFAKARGIRARRAR